MFQLCPFPFIARSFGKIEKSKWKYLAGTGLFGNAIPAILFPLAETNISSWLQEWSMLSPDLHSHCGYVVLRYEIRTKPHYRTRGWIGGCFTIDIWKNWGRSAGNPVYVWYIVLATGCYALSVNILRFPEYNRLCSQYRFAFVLSLGYQWESFFSVQILFIAQTVDGAGFSLMCYIVLLGLLSNCFVDSFIYQLIKISEHWWSSVTYLIPIVGLRSGDCLIMKR